MVMDVMLYYKLYGMVDDARDAVFFRCSVKIAFIGHRRLDVRRRRSRRIFGVNKNK